MSTALADPSPVPAPGADDTLLRLAALIETRKPAHGGDPARSYVARLLHQGPDAILKKIAEEAGETLMAAKDLQHGHGSAQALVGEMADLWFHSLIALAHFGLSPADVTAELVRREGLSGLEEKALRKLQQRQQDARQQEGEAA
ncbi:phosphoribosyl-ATP pyrophosphohydrolase [Serpentinimonas maccroryi]|uniref:Phosphoribosyl-ATP pyrophosphatase n=1 Tax=Serpentinimonas maccroryi TaxID=1458426 RepID=A0A060NY07_9BURK|nr:phosphoribosyl-ATP diphosphatase [Serpentinimonas maccroryi]BAO83769.1 phosphoribosyl-ATP pyrophosphohydrolase [Serpentinimonas maccroryi]